MKNPIEYNDKPADSLVFKTREIELNAGSLGRIFGSKANAPMNIAGALIILLVLSGISILFITTTITPVAYWGIITPLITLVMGFLFGKGGLN